MVRIQNHNKLQNTLPIRDEMNRQHVLYMLIWDISITKTRLFKYTENFTSKTLKFSDKKKTLIFFIFLLKT